MRSNVLRLICMFLLVVSIVTISFPAQAATIPCGDVNSDGSIDSGDALIVLQSIVGLETLNANQRTLADTDNNGAINAIDALLILQYSVGIVLELPYQGYLPLFKGTSNFNYSLDDICVVLQAYAEELGISLGSLTVQDNWIGVSKYGGNLIFDHFDDGTAFVTVMLSIEEDPDGIMLDMVLMLAYLADPSLIYNPEPLINAMDDITNQMDNDSQWDEHDNFSGSSHFNDFVLILVTDGPTMLYAIAPR